MTDTTNLECDGCGELATEFPHLVTFGFYDQKEDSFESKPPEQDRYCRECWREDFQRDKACHWNVRDPNRLWAVLEAADGELAADLAHMFVGGRPFVRVVDGELEGINIAADADQEEREVEFYAHETDVDREWLFSTMDAERSLPEDEYPTIALLKPADETPFGDGREVERHSRVNQ